jgi:four helix bundle protein
MGKVQNFTDLEAWRTAKNLALLIYKLTKRFPSEEKFCLIDQMKRSAVSISSNISEGFSRQSKKEKIQFYYMAKGSLTELHNQLILSKEIGYINERELNQTIEEVNHTGRLITGLINYFKR